MDISNKVIVITGAGQGIGQSIALYLAGYKAKFALIDVDQVLLQQTVELIEKQGSSAKAYLANVANEKEVEGVFKQIFTDFSAIDCLINNAGVLSDGLLIKTKDGKVSQKMSVEQFHKVIDVNLTGVFLCAREASIYMVEQKTAGVIINMSSVARGGNIGQTNYSAAKSGVVAMTVTWARELGKYGIRVAAIAPGVIRTKMTDAMKPEMRDRLIKMKPIGRLGDAKEIAHTVKYILENEFFTGRVIEVDGGLSM